MQQVSSFTPRRETASRRLDSDALTRLVATAAAGDQHSWNTIVREFGSLIWAVTRAHRLSDADAADVEQMTWMRLLEHLDDLRQPASLGAWIATTARRECLRMLRRAPREIPVSNDLENRGELEDPVDLAVLTGERDAALWRSFARLRASDQALLRLLIAYPRPAYEEVAAALDMPIGSIGPTRARALERLAGELERDGALELMAA